VTSVSRRHVPRRAPPAPYAGRVTTAGRTPRTDRADATRERILAAAERLFAERGIFAVSNRQVGEAAGQGNNFAVGYHFGSKTDLVLAVLRRHSEPMERTRSAMLGSAGDSADLRDWLDCLVRPITGHLDALGAPSWFARFAAQLMTDPGLRTAAMDEVFLAPSMQEAVAGLHRCLPELPEALLAERSDMVRHVVVHTIAERERALTEGAPTASTGWDEAATRLVDATAGLLLAPWRG